MRELLAADGAGALLPLADAEGRTCLAVASVEGHAVFEYYLTSI